MIPKIIHYCWLSNDPIPNNLQKYMQTWKEKLPDYEFMLWNFERFDINSSIWVKQAFEKKKYAFAADYIRLFAVYHYGGIYMDMDVEVVKSFNDLIQKDYLLGFESNIGIEAGIFGAAPKAQWIKICLDYYKNKEFINRDGSFNDMPLPKIMFKVLNEKYIQTDLLNIYPIDYLTAKSFKTGKIKVTPNTHTIHHFAGSWKSPKEKLIIAIAQVLGPKYTHVLGNIRRFLTKKK